MADNPQDLTAVIPSLAVRFQDRVIRQINRRSRFMSLLNWEAFDGKRLDWDVEGDGHIVEVYADADEPANYGSDKLVPATLSQGSYWAPWNLTAQAAAAAARAANPNGLTNLLMRNIVNSQTKLASEINKDLFNGTGANSVLGIETAVDSAGVYAGIDPATDAFWVSVEIANGGVPRALSVALMRETKRDIQIQSGEDPDLILTTPALADKYGQLAGSQRRFVDNIQTAAGTFSRIDLGWSALEFDGIPVVADKDATAGVMNFLNTDYIRGRYLPSLDFPNDGGVPSSMMPGGLPVDWIVEGRKGDKIKVFARSWPQLQVGRRNAHGKLTDLIET